MDSFLKHPGAKVFNNYPISGNKMLTVTPAATKQIKIFLENRDAAPVRIFLHSGGCGGPQIAMAFDELSEGDEVIKIEDITYIIEKEFFAAAQPISVEFTEADGFSVNSPMKFESGGCSGCSCGSSCGSN